MKFKRIEDIALILMSELAKSYRKDKYLSLHRVSELHGISELFLKKVTRYLKESELISSKEGVDGGYKLNRTPDNITLWDIIRSVNSDIKGFGHEPESVNEICMIKKSCVPQRINLRINEIIKDSFMKIHLSKLYV